MLKKGQRSARRLANLVSEGPVLGVMLLLGALLSAPVASHKAVAQETSYRKAEQYLEGGNTAAALIEIKNALQADPSSAEGRVLLGKIYLQTGEPKAAEAAFLRARELGASGDELDLLIAYARLGRGAFGEVVSEIANETERSTAVQRDLIVARGDALLALQRLEEAEEAYDAILAQEPHAMAYRGKAAIALTREQPEQSRAWLDRALALEPENADIVMLDAEWYFQDRQFGVARRRFEKAAELNDLLLLPRIGAIRSTLALGDTESALDEIAALKEAAPNNILVLHQDSVVQLAARNYEAAKRSADQVLARDRNHTMALNVAGFSAYSLGLYEQAAARLNNYVQARPDDRQSRLVLAVSLLRLRDVDAAKATLKPLLSEKPADAQVLSLMGTAEAMAGNTEAALQHLNDAVALSPEDAVLQSQLGLIRLTAGAGAPMVTDAMPRVGAGTGGTDDGVDRGEIALILGLLRAGQFDAALANVRRLLEGDPDSARLLVLAGLAHLGGSDEAAAEKAFSRAVELDPASIDARLNLARLKSQNGDLEAARNLLEEVIARQPDHVLALMDLASLAQQSGDVTGQAKWLERAVVAQPTLPTPRLRLALLYLGHQAAHKALETAEPGLAQNPESVEFLGIVGQAQLQSGESDTAIATFERLVETAPESVEAHFLLARTYGLTGRHKDMQSQLEHALELDPNHLPSQISLVRFLALDGKTEEARQRLQALKAAHPDNPAVLAQEGWMSLRRGDAGEAADLLQAAVDRSGPRVSRDLVEDLAEAHWQARNWEASIAVREAWLDNNPNDVPMLLAAAQSYSQLGRVEDAAEAYRGVHKRRPDSVIALNNLAWLLQKSAPDEALGYAEEANRLAPGTPWVMDTLGWLLLQRGETARAADLFAQASENAPGNPQYRYHLAQALGQAGQQDQAKRILEELLQDDRLASDHPKIRGMLQQISN